MRIGEGVRGSVSPWSLILLSSEPSAVMSMPRLRAEPSKSYVSHRFSHARPAHSEGRTRFSHACRPPTLRGALPALEVAGDLEELVPLDSKSVFQRHADAAVDEHQLARRVCRVQVTLDARTKTAAQVLGRRLAEEISKKQALSSSAVRAPAVAV